MKALLNELQEIRYTHPKGTTKKVRKALQNTEYMTIHEIVKKTGLSLLDVNSALHELLKAKKVRLVRYPLAKPIHKQKFKVVWTLNTKSEYPDYWNKSNRQP